MKSLPIDSGENCGEGERDAILHRKLGTVFTNILAEVGVGSDVRIGRNACSPPSPLHPTILYLI